MTDPPYRPEIILDCRNLQEWSQHKREAVILKAHAPKEGTRWHRMVGWSYVFAAFGTCLLAGGGVMFVLSVTIETYMESLTDRYDMHTTIQGAAIFCVGVAFILAALVKRYRHGHA
ncbi:hypothetical protein HPB50_020056 [Hyalomma asiaticum]|uniref:Uncharacterized protein n=1 Tax=Hyalomma asiaticum TaxID=266040 RepID=A0ACB7S9V3_HYAAI|nr:hypothetical protein HPB50_020056 [Hyalomma asiaticum]